MKICGKKTDTRHIILNKKIKQKMLEVRELKVVLSRFGRCFDNGV